MKTVIDTNKISITEWGKKKEEIENMIKYKKIMNPDQVIMTGYDTLIFFYKDVEKILEKIIEIYNFCEENEEEEPFCFGCEKPSLESFCLFGKTYNGIGFWYDKQGNIADEVFQKFRK